jgi:hypothetical protein
VTVIFRAFHKPVMEPEQQTDQSVAKRKSSFCDDSKIKYPMFEEAVDEHHARCTICNQVISVATQGASALTRHLNTSNHQKVAQAQGQQLLHSEEHKMWAADLTLAYHTAVHHHSYNSMNCTTSLNGVIYGDSLIALKLRCAKTKTEALVNHVIGPYLQEHIKAELCGVPFVSVSTDASNHGSTKLFPVILQYFTVDKGLNIVLLDLIETVNETSATISELIIKVLNDFDISKKCVGFGGDNRNTNFGGKNRNKGNNVLTHLEKGISQHIIGVGCSAHILHNCAQHGVNCLEFEVDSIVQKIYNYFSIYTVRTESLKQFCDFVNVEYETLLSHSRTRWLSLLPAVNKIITLYDGLKSFFLSEKKPPFVIKRFFESPLSISYLHIVKYIMTIFHTATLSLERKDNSVIEVLDILESVRRQLKEHHMNKFMPDELQQCLRLLTENGYADEVNKLKCETMSLYETCIDYLNEWLIPIEPLKTFAWMQLLTEPQWADVTQTMLFLKNYGVTIDAGKCYEEFRNLLAFFHDIKLDADLCHLKWKLFFDSKHYDNASQELLTIAQFFFSLPAHNANVERVFSLMTAQWTKERNRLSVSSVRSLLIINFNSDLSCKDFYLSVINDVNLMSRHRDYTKYLTSDTIDAGPS